MATVTLRPFGLVRGHDRRHGRPRRPPGLPHPDHDRRPPVGDRDRRHGPGCPVQRPGHERAGRRGVRRRRRHPARQDRHDHLRQPARRLDHAGSRRGRGRRRHGGPRRLDPGRDARGPLDRRARPQAAGRARRVGRHRRRSRLHRSRGHDRRGDPVPGRDPHERRPDLRRRPHPQGRRRRDRRPISTGPCRPRCSRQPTGSPTWAQPRSLFAATAASSA